MKTILSLCFLVLLMAPSTSWAQPKDVILKKAPPEQIQGDPNDVVTDKDGVTGSDKDVVKDTKTTPEVPNIEPNWKACVKDMDCVVIGRHCWLDTVNKRFEFDAERDLKEKNRDIKCDANKEGTTEKPDAICSDSICTLRY